MNSSQSQIMLEWYDAQKRDLPWRNSRDPYVIWVSEMMLQQTQVNTVRPYFEHFIQMLPTIYDLADVDDEKLMKLWQGLGYYARVKNMKKAATIIVDQYQGVFPNQKEDLLSLPGIGEYSSGAILSIAYDYSIPAIDGNVLRIFARLYNEQEEVTLSATKKRLKEKVIMSLPIKRCGDYNQALMDLGATICLGNGVPRCDECPLQGQCSAKNNNTQRLIPKKAVKKVRLVEEWMILLIRYQDQWLIHKRDNHGILSGMWEYPMLPVGSSTDVIQWIESQNGRIQSASSSITSNHLFTHREWKMRAWDIELNQFLNFPSNYRWVKLADIYDIYSIPMAFHAFTVHIEQISIHL